MKLLIDEQIEELRSKMLEVASDKDLTDNRVVSISNKLDVLINEFYLQSKPTSNNAKDFCDS